MLLLKFGVAFLTTMIVRFAFQKKISSRGKLYALELIAAVIVLLIFDAVLAFTN